MRSVRAVKLRNAGSRNRKLAAYTIKTGSLAEIVKANKSTNRNPTFLRRMRFSLDEHEIEQLSKEIDRASKRLRRLSKSAVIVLELRSASIKSLKFTSFLQSVQIQADRLYSAVGGSLSSCCHVEHDTKLLLSDRLEQFKNRERPIYFSLAIMSPSEGASRILLSHGVQVNVLEDDASGYVLRLDSERLGSSYKS